MKYFTSPAKGFSLVELMVVVVIIGILAAVAVPAYFNHVLSARQSDAYHNLLDIKAAQEMFYSQYDNYYVPPSPGALLTANTFTRLLSFVYDDTEYYRYRISSGGTFTFTAVAEGKFKKLIGDSIRITDSEDPIMSSCGELGNRLGLKDSCP